MDPNVTQQILDEIKKSYGSPVDLAKSTFSQAASATSGLTYYDLELGAKFLVPVLTPLRNEIPRVSGRGGIQANWRAITGINTTGLRIGVSGGNRGGVMAIATADYTASYKGIGLESNVDFEATYAAQNFDDVRAQAGLRTLQATMIGEEAVILGGNSGLSLGTTATPSLSASTSGGSLATNTYSVICVALTLDAYLNGTVAGGVQAQITRTNADGSTDTFGGGCAQKSAAATVSVTGPTGSLRLGGSWRHHDDQLGLDHGHRCGDADGRIAALVRPVEEQPGVRRSPHHRGELDLWVVLLSDGDRHCWHRHSTHGGWRGRHRRDRHGTEVVLG